MTKPPETYTVSPVGVVNVPETPTSDIIAPLVVIPDPSTWRPPGAYMEMSASDVIVIALATRSQLPVTMTVVLPPT